MEESGVVWSTCSSISRATFYLRWHTSLGNFLFGGKVDSKLISFPFLLSSCLSMEIQNIIQTQPSASTPTEPFLAQVHNSLCNTSTPLWHLLEKKERHRQPGWQGPSSPPAPHCSEGHSTTSIHVKPCHSPEHCMFLNDTANCYISQSFIYQIAFYASTSHSVSLLQFFTILICFGTQVHVSKPLKLRINLL